jgi:hypothetical protein
MRHVVKVIKVSICHSTGVLQVHKRWEKNILNCLTKLLERPGAEKQVRDNVNRDCAEAPSVLELRYGKSSECGSFRRNRLIMSKYNAKRNSDVHCQSAVHRRPPEPSSANPRGSRQSGRSVVLEHRDQQQQESSRHL